MKLFVQRVCSLYRPRLRPRQKEDPEELAFGQEKNLCECIHELRTTVPDTYHYLTSANSLV